MGRKKYWLIPLIIILSTVLLIWFLKTPIMGYYLSNKLKYNATFSNINVTSKQIYIKNFRIFNSYRSSNRYAFFADTVVVNYSFKNLFSKPSIIDDIVVNNIILNIECSNPLCSKNNWTDIVQRIKKKESNLKTDHEVIVRKLTFVNLNSNISNFGFEMKTKNVKVPRVDFQNVSSKKGFPTSELIAALFKSANLMDFLQGILDQGNMLDSIFKTFSLSEVDEN